MAGDGQRLPSFTAPASLLAAHLLPREDRDDDGDGDGDPLVGSRRIIDRETDYQRRRLNRTLSPPRIDPFATGAGGGGGGGAGLRSYGDALREAEAERQQRDADDKRRREAEAAASEVAAATPAAGDNFSAIPRRESGRRGTGLPSGRSRHRSRSPNPARPGVGGVGGGPVDAPAPDPAAGKPDFGLSGKLAAEANAGAGGATHLYAEPADACAPDPNRRWRLYVYKGKEEVALLHLHRQSHYLVGKDRRVCTLPADHPSISKQHAVLQYRRKHGSGAGMGGMGGMGGMEAAVLYVIDLSSTNGTCLNGTRIDPQRYYELRSQDVLTFGASTREYVLLQE